MQVGIKENGLEDSDKVIRAVMAERHAQELRDLEKQYAAEKKIMVDDALSKLSDKYDRLRDEMAKEHETELADLQVNEITKLLLSQDTVLKDTGKCQDFKSSG